MAFDEDDMSIIASRLRDGYVGGVDPKWRIELDFDHNDPEMESRVDAIADMIEAGTSSGDGWRLRKH